MLSFTPIMMKRETFAVADTYVPVKRRATLVQKRMDEIAASMLDAASRHQSWSVRMARVSCWLRACTGWKPSRRWRENHHRLPRRSAQALNGSR
jgi:hypothetical protein